MHYFFGVLTEITAFSQSIVAGNFEKTHFSTDSFCFSKKTFLRFLFANVLIPQNNKKIIVHFE